MAPPPPSLPMHYQIQASTGNPIFVTRMGHPAPPPNAWSITCILSKTRTLRKNIIIDPQEYAYKGFPPILSTKSPNTWRTNTILKVQMKLRTLFKKSLKEALGIRLSGVPSYTIYEISKKIEGKMSRYSFRNTFIKGFSLYYLQNLPKHAKNS